MLAQFGLSALAASLSVGDLRLEYGSTWQRADAEEETQAESVILRRPDATAPLTVMLPRHHARLRMPEEHFYRRLETVWRGQYGEAARLDWLQSGGRRWRMLRRPSLDRAGDVVFHLVTVIDGRAHHLLVHAPASVAGLPDAVRELLAVRHGASGLAAAPAPTAAAQAAPRHWRLERVVRIGPRQADLDRVMTLEQSALRREGGITGLALMLEEHGLDAFLQGFVWVPGPDRREVKDEFLHRWILAWTAPPALWREDEAAAILVSSGAGSDRVGLGIRLRRFCTRAHPRHPMLAAEAAAQGDAGAIIEAGLAPCRERTSELTQAEVTPKAGEAAHPIFIQPPDTTALPADDEGLMVLTLQPRVADGSPGQALLKAAAVHYVYVRGQ